MYDQKAFWDRLGPDSMKVNKHGALQALSHTTITVSEMQLAFTITESPRTLMHQICIRPSELTKRGTLNRWFGAERQVFFAVPSNDP